MESFSALCECSGIISHIFYSYIGHAPYSLPAGRFAGKNISWLQEESIFKKNNEFQSSFSIGCVNPGHNFLPRRGPVDTYICTYSVYVDLDVRR